MAGLGWCIDVFCLPFGMCGSTPKPLKYERAKQEPSVTTSEKEIPWLCLQKRIHGKTSAPTDQDFVFLFFVFFVVRPLKAQPGRPVNE